MPHSPIRQLLILLLLFVLPASPMAEETQNVMSDLKDFVVESEWGKKQKKRFDDFKENVDSTFQPLVRLREQHACSAGWRGNECEQMFPETRERVGRSLESLQENAASAPRRISGGAPAGTRAWPCARPSVRACRQGRVRPRNAHRPVIRDRAKAAFPLPAVVEFMRHIPARA